MPRRPLLIARTLLATALFSSLAWSAPTPVAGTQITLDPPEGFARADRFPGFQKPEAGASIMVTEMPAPYPQIRQAMTEQGLATRGMTLISSDAVKVGGAEALLVHVGQAANGIDFLKWMLVTGDDKQTVMIVATYPKAAAAKFGEPLKQSVLSATRDVNAKVDPWDGLQYRVAPGAPLKLAKRISNTMMFNESGVLGGNNSTEAVYLVGSSVADPAMADLKAFSEQRAAAMPQVKNFTDMKGRKLKVDGMDAYELVADAADTKSDAPMKYYQTIAKELGGYYIFIGAAGAKDGDAMVKTFRDATATFKRVAPAK
jgi:hypothetical protein